jgi:hypothetical protein
MATTERKEESSITSETTWGIRIEHPHDLLSLRCSGWRRCGCSRCLKAG